MKRWFTFWRSRAKLLRRLDELERYYEKLYEEKKAAGTSEDEMRDLGLDQLHEKELIEDDLWREACWYYQGEADRQLIPVPEYSTNSKEWVESEVHPGRYYLSRAALTELKRQIHAEKKETWERLGKLIAMLTGLVGAISGLAAILRK